MQPRGGPRSNPIAGSFSAYPHWLQNREGGLKTGGMGYMQIRNAHANERAYELIDGLAGRLHSIMVAKNTFGN